MFPFPYFIIYVLVVEILLQYRTADAEIKILTVEHPGVENAVPGAGQNIATYALATTRNIFIVLISRFSVYSTFFSLFFFFSRHFPYLLTALVRLTHFALLALAIKQVTRIVIETD